MSKLQRDVFERRGNALLSELGYEAYSEVPRSISAIFLEQWYTLNLAGNLNTLAARFGLRRRSQLERNWRRGKNKKRQAAKYQDAQREAFGSLVQRGVISNGFRHAAASVSFVQDTVNRALNGAPEGGGLSILDCGCGTGVWLEHLRDTRRDANPSTDRFFGFDLTPEMVELARQRLQPLVPAEHLQIGDVLRDDSYEFTSAGQKYDLIFAYDIVQQLPRRLQLQACRAMLEHLSSNGVLMVFDNDAQSYHGRVMGMKKLITRYLHINLVPRFYLNARYPALGRLARRLEAEGRYRSEIHVAPNGVKRALVVRARQSA